MSTNLGMLEQNQTSKIKLYSFIILLPLIAIIPNGWGWERLQFFLVLLLPIVLCAHYFQLEKETLKKSFIFLGIFIIANLSTFGLHVWQLVWEISNPNGLFGFKIPIDPLLYSIPFNDGTWLWQLSTPLLLDQFFVWIYVHGFVFCLLALAVYYLLTGQPNKILLAMFAGHFLQYLLILPFHFWVDGHQVWWIYNQWFGTTFTDPLLGHRTITEPIIPSLNHVFPSMHTSIAFVTILLALREKAKPIRYFFVPLNILIIISTVYLGIHWVIDLAGGMIFGYVVLKLSDKIMATQWKEKWTALKEKKPVYHMPLTKPEVKHQESHLFWRDDK
ncbi:phosphatase PAP2 family protein [Bacillus alkalicellulosilyticus]|uniref:phosphatase PAP2 family protein n=1 Tax=Alkalihalobacterium alkalicellulosilyticum TaxID=1912214 RepID=UPI001483AD25|nr:phosphatase PAP2 family protein [Bacillus alkalicellulosilyticus]